MGKAKAVFYLSKLHKMQNVLSYTTIDHTAQASLNITLNEYCVACFIHWGANNPKNNTGWCYASKQTIGERLLISKKSILQIISRLISLDLVEKHPETKYLRVTEKWFDSIYPNGLPSVTKGYQAGNERLPQAGNERLPYNTNINIDNKEYSKTEVLPTLPINNKTAVKENTEIAPPPAAPEKTKQEIEEEEKFAVFKKWIQTHAARVEELKKPFTLSDYKELKNLKVNDKLVSGKDIQDLLLKMHNWKPLLQKNISAFLTLKNWLTGKQ